MKVVIRATVGAGVERFDFLHRGVDDPKVSAGMIVFAPKCLAADELGSRRCGRGARGACSVSGEGWDANILWVFSWPVHRHRAANAEQLVKRTLQP